MARRPCDVHVTKNGTPLDGITIRGTPDVMTDPVLNALIRSAGWMTLAEIGAVLERIDSDGRVIGRGVSRERVRQIENEALEKLGIPATALRARGDL